MSDYGFRISEAGKDVKTCDDLDCILTSKYYALKGAITGSGTFDADKTLGTVTIAHNLGYIPVCMVNLKLESTSSRYQASPLKSGGLDWDISVWHYADDTNLYIKHITGILGNDNIAYKYFIYKDKGKV